MPRVPRTRAAETLGSGQLEGGGGRAADDGAVLLEARAVAGALPRALVVVEVEHAAQVGAAGPLVLVVGEVGDPVAHEVPHGTGRAARELRCEAGREAGGIEELAPRPGRAVDRDRKSTRLNSSH